MLNDFQAWLASLGLSPAQVDAVVQTLTALLVIIVSIIADVVARGILLKALQRIAARTRNNWDDIVLRRRVFHRLAHLTPAIIVWIAAPFVLSDSPAALSLTRRAVNIYMLMVSLSALNALIGAVNDIYIEFPIAHRIPIKGYLQVVQIIAIITVGIFTVSIAAETNPWGLLTGLGALTAILLLVFKDTILGLVAGVQLGANDMVRPGDWIEMQKYGADGDVIDITLNTVKVRNWDKTITTIPTYALISDSFRNWRGMTESGGRRIKRSVFIDVSSIRFSTPEMIERFSRIERLKSYIHDKQQELAAFNQEHGIDESVPVNGRRMTNLGTFRAYLTEYLHNHPQIHQDMTFLVRQLQPTEHGLPIEIYVFSKDQVWANYEGIQADIFDHIYAALPEFDLRPFQSPSGHDIVEGATQLALRPAGDRVPQWQDGLGKDGSGDPVHSS